MPLHAVDLIALQNLVYRYCWHLDHGDFDAMAALFSDAVVHLDPAGTFDRDPAGIAAVYRTYVKLHADGTPRTRHVTTNLILDPVGEDEVRSNSSVVVFQQADTLGLQPIIVTRNHDRFVRVDGTWRFAERSIEMNLLGNLSAHMLQSL
jgi:3-phenylpropionate/cinnamic acid dioxygenase small subunit